MMETPTPQDTKWYVLRVISGKEKKVKEYLDKDIIRMGWDKVIKQIFLPVEKVYKIQKGKKSGPGAQLLPRVCDDRG